MKFVAVLICATFVLISGDPSGALVPEPDTLSTTPPATTITSETTTVVTSTSTPTTTSTTSKPTTSTTTIKPTTSNSTTAIPSTTVVPITTIKPTPAPVPRSGQWIVNGENKTCIVMKMTTQFNITYLNGNKTVSQEIVLPRDNETVTTGVCNETEQVLNISWTSKSPMNNSLSFHFVVENGTKAYQIHHIDLYLALIELPNINTTNSIVTFIHNKSENKVELGNSYRCAKLQRISLTSNVKNTTGVIEVSDFQFQAFRTDNTKTFGAAEDCAVETQDIVPIAVGCSLAILIIIVLTAYLIGRRRGQAGGYISM